MSRDIWNPRQYRAYSSHRARPFFELLARVDAETPAYVVDLGCGPGERTADLAARWPGAVVEGIDSSEQMISEARRHRATDGVAAAGAIDGAVRGGEMRTAGRAEASERTDLPADIVGHSEPPPSGPVIDGIGGGGGSLSFSVGDLVEWVPERPVDVIFSNAALQWVPGHQRLLPRWVEALVPGGCLAFSMPGNFDGPSHTLLRELCESPRWRDRLAQVNRHNIVADPAEYYELLTGLGCDVDAWETTYLQVLHGTDPVLEWMKGTALRPALSALPGEKDREDFLTELAALLRDAYPPGPHGTIFPFRRIFVVAVAP